MSKSSIRDKLKSIAIVHKVYKSVKETYYYLRRCRYIKTIRRYLENCGEGPVSIISSNCFGGHLYQDFKLEYSSPTAGLWILPSDFPVFCERLAECLQSPIEWVERSKTARGNLQRNSKTHWYPMGYLKRGGVEIHFLHYHTREDAETKWHRRCARVNLNNVFLIGMDQNGCTEDDIRAFDNLPMAEKVFFSAKPVAGESVIYLPRYAKKGEVGNPYSDAHVFYRELAKWMRAREKQKKQKK